MHANEKLLCHHPCSMSFVMNFENIVISPPDDYRFLNFVPNVINTIYILSYKKIYKSSGGLL